MSIVNTLAGQQSAAFRMAESIGRFNQISKIGETPGIVITGVTSQAISSHFCAAARLQDKVHSALEPGIAVAAQLQLHQSKLAAALAPVAGAAERLRELSEAIKINTSFRRLGEASAFTQIRYFEEFTGDRLLKFDEDHFIHKIALSNSFEPIGAGLKIEADFLPFQPLPDDGYVRYFEEPNNAYRAFEDQPSFPNYTTTCPTKHFIEPNFRPRHDYLAIITDRNLSIEERGRAFALSGLPFHYWSNYFCDEEFDTWVEDEVETAKRHRERILCFVNKINQIYRRASRIVLQAYRRLTKTWKNASVFSWRYAHLNRIHTLKDAEIKLSDFFISTTQRHSRGSSFFSYEFCRTHDFPPPGNSL
ncbi:hypothetical protein [Neolewinella agarilytica]|uniref:Uncharacterized protein n=1 Tax=Neolewinella agarilytica TaxID=478744 RepID=A0A1H9H6U4_9BACT|nr:hypothetical protein [Neolewinella agarilytica]SEQ58003.1 hypothetical protein SAMN05444359_11238 [Neolewinella agarilytica]